MVTDREILDAYGLIATREGVFCEPASAACVAGLLKLVRGGLTLKGISVVCVITGTGLKEPELPSRLAALQPNEIAADLRSVEEALGLIAVS